MELGFFSLPMSAGPRDAVVGQDELGRPVRQTVLGQQYGFQAPAPSVPYAQQLATVGQPDNRAQGMRLGDTVVANPDREGLGGADALAAVRGLIDGATQGITAPARAARGEPVTYGDVAATALDYGIMGAPMAAPEGAIRANSFRAYHGSPHDFDRFSLDRIGTGTGEQNYGRGIYLTQSEPAAQRYRDMTSMRLRGVDMDGRTYSNGITQDVKDFASREGISEEAARTVLAYADAGPDHVARVLDSMRRSSMDWEKAEIPRVEEALAYMRANPVTPGGRGHVYEVQINADPNAFLNWDAPLSQQPEAVRGFYGEVPQVDATYVRNIPDGAAAGLRDAGVPGVRYAEGNTTNYVVFDDSIIEIIRKYGVAGAAPMLGLTAQQLQSEMDAQGVQF